MLALASRRAEPVLLVGETGTGKELAARGLHAAWKRKGPLVCLNGAGLRDLAASRLFGHVKGAFTGADRDTPGAFVEADGGTLFLDEINSLPLEVQGQLLRVLETGQVVPLGRVRPRTVNVRVVCATNTPLAAEVEAGRFRDDLWYRLDVIAVHLPPLRERTDDIPLLVEEFLERQAERYSIPVLHPTPGAIALLLAHPWAGNVRELQNVLARASLHCDDEHVEIGAADMERALRPRSAAARPGGGHAGYKVLMAEFEKRLLVKHLQAAGWNFSEAARRLNMSRQALQARAKRLGIEASVFGRTP